jgi:hypothetical protein
MQSVSEGVMFNGILMLLFLYYQMDVINYKSNKNIGSIIVFSLFAGKLCREERTVEYPGLCYGCDERD